MNDPIEVKQDDIDLQERVKAKAISCSIYSEPRDSYDSSCPVDQSFEEFRNSEKVKMELFLSTKRALIRIYNHDGNEVACYTLTLKDTWDI